MKNITVINFILQGINRQKGNNRQIVFNRKTGKPMVIKDKKAIKSSNDFVIQLRNQFKGHKTFTGLVKMIMIAYYPNNRFDLDDSLICDCLQKAGIIQNDRQIVEKVLLKRFDKENPRVKVEVIKLVEKDL